MTALRRCAPGPLGAHEVEGGLVFRVFSEAAERVELCLFDAAGATETARLAMPECLDGVWQGFLPDATAGLVYGYRAHGACRPERGEWFNASKLLLDPYAKRVQGTLTWHPALDASDARDTAPFVPKAVVAREDFDWQDDRRPHTSWRDTVISELHVKGISALHPDIPAEQRGRYAALGHPALIAHFKALGITAVELLPIAAFVRERRLVEQGLTNYWGYNSLAFMAPEPAYGTAEEFKTAIRALHAAGIEVILDVVFNHNAEGDETGPVLSLKGLGNAQYFRLDAADPGRYVNDTGCGNTLDFTHPRTVQLAMDALRHWAIAYRVDGFRFDLGVSLGRGTEGFDARAPLYAALLQDPLLSSLKLVMEPWDIGPGGYQVGAFAAGFAEWNDASRDDLRRYWRGDALSRPGLATRLQGSADRFDHHRRAPWASVNFVTAHDGFTLADVVRYAGKHNHANGEHNRDGTGDNHSANWGVEGATDDAAIQAQRSRIQRALIASLAFSHGTPMLLAGDEFGQTQQGNNNAYCQDSPLTWLDWSLAKTPEGKSLQAFLTRVLALRRAHPALRAEAFQHGRNEPVPGWPDALWFDERGLTLTAEDWANPHGRLLGLRRIAASADGQGYEALYLLCNADSAAYHFTLPRPAGALEVLLDSFDEATPTFAHDGIVAVRPHSLVLLLARPGAPA